MALAQVNTAQPKTAMSRIDRLKRCWDETVEEEEASRRKSLQDEDEVPFDGWHPSPERPLRHKQGNQKMSTDEFWASMKHAKAELQMGASNMLKAKADFDQQASKSLLKGKQSMATPAVSIRPVKRKSDMIELSDSEEEPVNKRRQPVAPPAKPTKVAPWDEDHSKKKLPAPMPTQSSSASTSANASTSTSKPRPADIVSLSPQQQSILDIVMEGDNVFFTGSAGTGKSVLLRSIIKRLRSKYARSPDAIAITASTGIAACNIGGITLHSFSGVGLGTDSAPDLAAKVKKNPKASTRWSRTKVLIIDEISMLDGDFFDKLENVARIIRKNSKPFGGIQLILTGDFFQLPPVARGVVKFAFNANCWSKCVKKTYNLTRVFRQKDQEFVAMLNEMRFGKLSQKSVEAFMRRSRPLPADGIEPTELFPRREDVDRANKERMDRLVGESYTYEAMDGGEAEEKSKQNILSNFMAPKSLTLKVDAQVMMIKNVDEQLVNGTVGKIVAFMTETEWQESLAAAAGRQLEEGETEKPSRSKKYAGLKYPVVEWKIVGSRYTRKDLVREEQFKVEGVNGKVEVSRTQLPLILAWAMSIHKSQGQTLEKVKIDLRKVFEKGQAYVAISRATSLDGLQVIGFQANKVYAHPAVIEWSKTLTSS